MGMFGSGFGNALTLIGASLKDASPGSQGGNLAAAQQFMAQRALLQARLGLFGRLQQIQQQAGQPQSNTDQVYAPELGLNPPRLKTAPGLSIDNPEVGQLAQDADLLGVPLTSTMDYLKANQPHVIVTPSGEAINEKDPGAVGRLFPKLDSGQIYQNGVVSNAPGYVNSAAEAAGAVTGAQEQQRANLDLVDVPVKIGGQTTTIKLPRGLAAPILAQQAGKLLGPGGAAGGQSGAQGGAQGDAASGGVDSIGVAASPAEITLANKRSETQAQREQLEPKEAAALRDLDNRSALTSQIIHQILGDVQDPRTGQWRATGHSMLSPLTTGVLGNSLKGIYQPGANLEAQIDHVEAMTALDQLQKLREESPTGAGLGRVTQSEIDLLASMNGSVSQKQDPTQMAQNLRRQLTQLDKIRANRQQQFQETYGGIQQPTPGSTAPIPPRQAPQRQQAPAQPSRAELLREARRRGLIQ